MSEANIPTHFQASDQENPKGHCRRDGEDIVVPVGADLPPTCVKCNAPAVTPVQKRRVYWHHPAWYLLLLAYGVGYALVLVFRKKAVVSPGLCAYHSAARKRKIGFFATALIVALFLWGFFEENEMLDAGAVAFILAWVFLFLTYSATKILKASKITATEITLKGCGEPFLQAVATKALEASRKAKTLDAGAVGCPFCGRTYEPAKENYVCPSCAAPAPAEFIHH